MGKILLGLNVFLGIGAAFGAYFCFSIKEGQELMGVSTEILKNSPFTTFLIPGLFLLIVISFGNLLTGFLLWKNKGNPYYCELLLGFMLATFILIQMYMLLAVEALHLIFFGIGALQLILALLTIRRENIPLPFQAHQN